MSMVTIEERDMVGVKEYLKAIRPLEESKVFMGKEDGYWSVLPSVHVSTCPYCVEEYREQLDLYSLRYWILKKKSPFSGGISPFEHTFSDLRSQSYSHCDHFERAHVFINLNGNMPEISDTELAKGIWLRPEVPHVISPVLQDSVGATAVFNDFPIHRIESDRFVPRYTLYVLTYFTENEQKKDLYRKALVAHNVKYHKGETPPRPTRPEHENWYDLKPFVESKRLGWMQKADRDSRLLFHGDADFPHYGIEGRRKPYWKPLPYNTYEV